MPEHEADQHRTRRLLKQAERGLCAAIDAASTAPPDTVWTMAFFAILHGNRREKLTHQLETLTDAS